MPKFDVAIVGGGVIGSSIASFLRSSSDATVCVVERDPTYQRASSALSASSIRQQFTTELNIRVSQYGFSFLKNISEHLAVDDDDIDVGLVERGYLVLASTGSGDALRQNVDLQAMNGADIELLQQPDLANRYPWLTVTDLDAGAYGRSGEGWFDGYSLLQAFKRKARALGATYLRDEVVGFRSENRRVAMAECLSGETIEAGMFINAAGPQAASICGMLGISIPVSAKKRDVFVLDCPAGIDEMPMLFDPSGLWIRPDGSCFISGMAPAPEKDPDNVSLDAIDQDNFESRNWPTLAHRIPAFEELRVSRAWSGYYAMNAFDHNAIVGKHPDFENFILANGFSGHGMQQAPAIGRGVAELVNFGEFRSLDLRPFRVERIRENDPIVEAVVY